MPYYIALIFHLPVYIIMGQRHFFSFWAETKYQACKSVITLGVYSGSV